jgi:hypothetical protein
MSSALRDLLLCGVYFGSLVSRSWGSNDLIVADARRFCHSNMAHKCHHHHVKKCNACVGALSEVKLRQVFTCTADDISSFCHPPRHPTPASEDNLALIKSLYRLSDAIAPTTSPTATPTTGVTLSAVEKVQSSMLLKMQQEFVAQAKVEAQQVIMLWQV